MFTKDFLSKNFRKKEIYRKFLINKVFFNKAGNRHSTEIYNTYKSCLRFILKQFFLKILIFIKIFLKLLRI